MARDTLVVVRRAGLYLLLSALICGGLWSLCAFAGPPVGQSVERISPEESARLYETLRSLDWRCMRGPRGEWECRNPKNYREFKHGEGLAKNK